jgi:hypothetical protein
MVTSFNLTRRVPLRPATKIRLELGNSIKPAVDLAIHALKVVEGNGPRELFLLASFLEYDRSSFCPFGILTRDVGFQGPLDGQRIPGVHYNRRSSLI